MSKRLGIELVTDGTSQMISELSIGRLILGREPPEGSGGIRLHSAAISRSHGEIRAIRQHWFYSDLGSTNGSWLNGVQIQKGTFQLLRPKDTLQLADVVLRIVDRGGEMPPRSVLVFKGDELIEEMPVPQSGQVLSIGGPAAQFEIEQSNPNEHALVIEVRGQNVVAYQDDPSIPATCAGSPIGAEQPLSDRSSVEIGSYVIVFQDPPMVTDGGTKVLSSWDSSSSKHDTGGIRATASGVFGKAQPVSSPNAGTVAMKPAEVSEYMAAISGSRRSSKPKKSSMSQREMALVIFIIVTLSLALFLLIFLLL